MALPEVHPETAALEMVNVRKIYGTGDTEVIALNDASLRVGSNEILALVGPSGSGKTTLLSIAGALLEPTSGQVLVGGEDITRLNDKQRTAFRRSSVGFVFQQVNLVPFLTARENLLVVADFAKRRRDAGARADLLLGELGLAHRLKNLPGQLSGGERQRVAIGRALMNQPKLILVDEPTSALDTKLGEQVMELIVSEVRARNTAAVIVTHDHRMAAYADRSVEIHDGNLAQ
ncbi:MAG: ABC transporter ATP-binding protein [Acidimicrobiia bacterium]